MMHLYRTFHLTRSLTLSAALLAALVAALVPGHAVAQTAAPLDPFARPAAAGPNPLSQPTISPGLIMLMELEGRFASDVAKGGGKAFASWFADDGVTLGNGRPAVRGKAAIAAAANWDPKDYQLTWVPEGGQISPQEDMGFTWGHYESHARDKAGNAVVQTGRYMTVWKKLPDGTWKVALDSSAEEPPDAAECCT